MTEPRRIGNRRKFKLSNHRLSKQAFLQTVEQLEQAVMLQNVLLYGRGPYQQPMGGVVSSWRYTTTGSIVNLPYEGELAYNDADGVVKGVRYDPSSPAQSVTQIDLSLYVGQNRWIWWKRGESETTVRSEAHWVSPTGEQFTPTETILAERVDFGVTHISTPHPTYNLANGWRLLAKVVGWTGSTPELRFIPFIDSAKILTRDVDVSAVDPDVLSAFYGGAVPATANDGVVHLLKRVVDQLWMLADSAVNVPTDPVTAPTVGTVGTWYRKPRYGTKQIDDTLDDILGRVTAVEAASGAVLGIVYAVETPVGSGVNPVAVVPTKAIGTVLTQGAVTVTRTANGVYQYDFPIDIGPTCVAVATTNNLGLLGVATQDVTTEWTSDTRLVVRIVSNIVGPVYQSKAHNLIIVGSL